MINEFYKNMLSGKSVIRQLSEYATKRGQEIGYENVFDFSLGNPSVPVPSVYNEEIIRLHREADSSYLHGYSPSPGIYEVRQAIAESLKKRFDMDYRAEHIFMTSGAAGAIAHAIRSVTRPGDEVIVFAPCFPEYHPYIEHTGAKLKMVPADTESFQINFEAFEELLTDEVQAVLINTPNNPSGVVYSVDTLKKLAEVMRRKQAEYGHDIFLISDEPYREILFAGKDSIKELYPSRYYDNTLSCYSYSKSLSVPGERIGYVAVNPAATDADILAVMMTQISRGIGHNCPSSSVQRALIPCLYETSDLSVYEKNMEILYKALTSLGFSVVKPSGTFYIFPRALEDDANAFCMKARDYDLILVPSDSFGCPGHFRIAYCVDTEKVERSLPVFEKFVKECYKNG